LSAKMRDKNLLLGKCIPKGSVAHAASTWSFCRLQFSFWMWS
jgi:hypothetical protein